MKTDLTAHAETAYHGFKSIDSGEYREKISFVDRNRIALRDLPVAEYAEVMDAYAEALFETGKYEEHIRLADHLAELAMEYNLDRINGRDLYFETLFQKAASLYNMDRLDDAIFILRELIRIDPKHDSTRLFLINCHVEQQKSKLQICRTISVVLILASAAVIAFELLVVRSFFLSFVEETEVVRNTLFITGAGILVIGELWVRYHAVSKVYDFTHRKPKSTDNND
jgi:tetratricopeptide (TPR) repeat protein